VGYSEAKRAGLLWVNAIVAYSWVRALLRVTELNLPLLPLKRSKRPPKVALLIETSNAYGRGLLVGVKEYIRTHGPWNVHLVEQGRGDRPPKWITDWDGDGVLARVESPEIARSFANSRIPIVDLSFHRHLPHVPAVSTDNQQIGRLALEHFRERELRNLAFCGVERYSWSLSRAGYFDELVRDAGLSCIHYSAPKGVKSESDAETDEIATWLLSLPKPVGVFSAHDGRALQVIEACHRVGLAVPEQVAVLGIDNDDLLCDLSTPPLSSVILDTQKIGWTAAELLSKLMRGQLLDPVLHVIPPLGVCTRKSTDVTAVADAHVAHAAHFIREHACAGIDASDVVAAIPLARRVLEKRFQAVLNRTIRQEITRVQMQRVMDLLVTTSLSLAEIAQRTGFRHVEYLTVVFKREFGIPPSTYRDRQRNGLPLAV
jgi:LacI family transcriptional regulator